MLAQSYTVIMFQDENLRLPGFWSMQAAGWVLLYVLVLLPALPHVREPGVLAYNSWAILMLFGASVAIRPILRYGLRRWKCSWIRLEAFAFVTCLGAGTGTTFVIALLAFGAKDLSLRTWDVSGIQCTIVLFLWSTLYLSLKSWRPVSDVSEEPVPLSLPTPSEEKRAPEQSPYAARFVARSGSRLQIVTPDKILWVAAAGDYIELHTDAATHTLRETMTSLEKKLDPAHFLRIHRSRIVRTDQITELIPMDNLEFRLRLSDGSEHRSSRTYAPALQAWMRSSQS